MPDVTAVDVENMLPLHSTVAEAVVGLLDDRWGQRVAAFVAQFTGPYGLLRPPADP